MSKAFKFWGYINDKPSQREYWIETTDAHDESNYHRRVFLNPNCNKADKKYQAVVQKCITFIQIAKPEKHRGQQFWDATKHRVPLFLTMIEYYNLLGYQKMWVDPSAEDTAIDWNYEEEKND